VNKKDKYVLVALACTAVFLTWFFVGEYIDGRLEQAHKDGVVVGYQLALNTNQPTVAGCMSFYFNDDPKRVAQAIKTLCNRK